MPFAQEFTNEHELLSVTKITSMGWENMLAEISNFQAFWDAYPVKIGKFEAQRVYFNMLRDGHQESDIIAGAMRFSELCRVEKTEPRFIPHPATWLRAGRWMDENLEQYKPIDPQTIEANKDKADRLMRRGKYAPNYN